jgi:hypothetical protein
MLREMSEWLLEPGPGFEPRLLYSRAQPRAILISSRDAPLTGINTLKENDYEH